MSPPGFLTKAIMLITFIAFMIVFTIIVRPWVDSFDYWAKGTFGLYGDAFLTLGFMLLLAYVAYRKRPGDPPRQPNKTARKLAVVYLGTVIGVTFLLGFIYG